MHNHLDDIAYARRLEVIMVLSSHSPGQLEFREGLVFREESTDERVVSVGREGVLGLSRR
jgi:hypothetical protein